MKGKITKNKIKSYSLWPFITEKPVLYLVTNETLCDVEVSQLRYVQLILH